MSNTPDPHAARRRELYSLMGDLPARDREVSATLISREERPGYILEKLMLDLNGIELVPAYYASPKDATGRIPVILYNHAHGGDYILGKDEALNGRLHLQKPPYAEELTRRGWAMLSIDSWAFGERRGRTEPEIFKEMLWRGQVMWGMMVYDSIKAIDYLVTRPGIDPARIGTIGLSMGSTMAWWLAALDPRIKVTVDLCCLTDFHALLDARGTGGHGIYYFVPSLLKYFSTGQINALIAPRPHLGIAGIYDELTPPAGLDHIDREVSEAYAAAGAPEAWKLSRYACGHMETAAMRAEAMGFLERWL